MYAHVFVAGTFDGLHKGHRFLLSEAFRHGEKVTIGLTSDAFIGKFKILNSQFSIQSQNQRKKELVTWLKKEGYMERATIVSISDPYEPAASLGEVDALVVTPETRKRGEEINQMREARGLKPLTLIEVPIVNAQDGTAISATRVRNGEIDRHGRLVMPESLRPALQKPLGRVCSGKAIDEAIRASKGKLIIAVGDVTTKAFLDAGRVPDVSIIDGRVGRRPYKESRSIMAQLRKGVPFEANRQIKSGPGYISRSAIEAIRRRIPLIEIRGEEDLLVLPAVIHAPLDAMVYYGQPDEGMVEVVVTPEIKKTAEKLLKRFSTAPFAGGLTATSRLPFCISGRRGS